VWISEVTETSTFEMDELFWYINRKENTKTRENTYIILLISVNPRQIVGYYTGKKRTAEIMQRIVDNSIQAKQYATDGNFTYKDVIFPGKHIQNFEDKSDTHNVESINADLRTYISGLRRRSRCFYRSEETLDAVMSLFADAYNKFGEAKAKYRIPVRHRPGNENKHLHQYRDAPFSLIDFL